MGKFVQFIHIYLIRQERILAQNINVEYSVQHKQITGAGTGNIISKVNVMLHTTIHRKHVFWTAKYIIRSVAKLIDANARMFKDFESRNMVIQPSN